MRCKVIVHLIILVVGKTFRGAVVFLSSPSKVGVGSRVTVTSQSPLLLRMMMMMMMGGPHQPPDPSWLAGRTRPHTEGGWPGLPARSNHTRRICAAQALVHTPHIAQPHFDRIIAKLEETVVLFIARMLTMMMTAACLSDGSFSLVSVLVATLG